MKKHLLLGHGSAGAPLSQPAPIYIALEREKLEGAHSYSYPRFSVHLLGEPAQTEFAETIDEYALAHID